nr:MAG TPA: hypothetical protein [Caudoviricetes sp.]
MGLQGHKVYVLDIFRDIQLLLFGVNNRNAYYRHEDAFIRMFKRKV